MEFHVLFTPSAEKDLDYFKTSEKRVIVDALKIHLLKDANLEGKRRKPLTENYLAPWELRIGKYRVFYEFETGMVVKIVAIGYKKHNELFIRGKKVEL